MEFFSPRSALCSEKSFNVMALQQLQPTACMPERARNREFQTTGTGNYQAISERNRERTGGRKRGAKPGVAGLQGAARIPFLYAWKAALARGRMRSDSSKDHLAPAPNGKDGAVFLPREHKPRQLKKLTSPD
jgi:hypothetical protein